MNLFPHKELSPTEQYCQAILYNAEWRLTGTNSTTNVRGQLVRNFLQVCVFLLLTIVLWFFDQYKFVLTQEDDSWSFLPSVIDNSYATFCLCIDRVPSNQIRN